MKYKVGDKVRVHTIEWFEQNCSKNCVRAYEHQDGDDTVVIGMTKFCGQELTINQVDLDLHRYYVLEDNECWSWEDWMFESMNNNTNNNTNTISNSNIVEDFAELIGVELDEEFYDEARNYRYKITSTDGFMFYNPNTELWQVCTAYPLTAFLKMVKEGKFTKKWIPQGGDRVYFPVIVSDTLYDDTIYNKGNAFDEEMLEKGLYFKTQEEAIECAKKMIKQVKEG